MSTKTELQELVVKWDEILSEGGNIKRKKVKTSTA